MVIESSRYGARKGIHEDSTLVEAACRALQLPPAQCVFLDDIGGMCVCECVCVWTILEVCMCVCVCAHNVVEASVCMFMLYG